MRSLKTDWDILLAVLVVVVLIFVIMLNESGQTAPIHVVPADCQQYADGAVMELRGKPMNDRGWQSVAAQKAQAWALLYLACTREGTR